MATALLLKIPPLPYTSARLEGGEGRMKEEEEEEQQQQEEEEEEEGGGG
jgi:ribosomal protein L12E/L44/L45/RPP1/RPP2